MNYKRGITVIAGILCCVLCGCGTNIHGDRTETGTELKWLLPGDTQSDVLAVMDEVNKITEEKIGVKVDIQTIDTSAYTEKMRLNMAAKLDCDICFTGFVNPYSTAADNGGLLDITDMIDKTEGLREALPDYMWDMATLNGHIYGVPNQQILATANAIEIPAALVEKYKLDVNSINHIDDIEPFLEQIKQNEPDYYPFRPNYGLIPWQTKYEAIVGEYVALPKGSKSSDDLVYLYETEEQKHGERKLHEWYKKGYIRRDVLSIGDDTSDYRSGKYAVSFVVWKPGVEYEESNILGYDVKVIPIDKPYITKGKGLTTMWAVSRTSKHPEESLEFIKLLNTDKALYNLVCFGIEGKHYTLEDGKVNPIPNSGYNQNGATWKFGNTFNALLMKGQDENVIEETKNINNTADKSTLMGFMLDRSSIKSEISNLSSVTSEYAGIGVGSLDPDSVNAEKYERMKSAGVERIYTEVKKQLDEYFKNLEE